MKNKTGEVCIIGSGPGAPDLMTLRALRAVSKSDVLICDRLLPKSFFETLGMSQDEKKIHWRGEDDSLKSQDQINEFMLRCARLGRNVARLKTGDPHIFGRGMEELEFLTRNGVRCEVIPGITAATAFSSITDMPLTHRGKQNSFAVVTARGEGGAVNDQLPRADSIVIFMGVSVLNAITETLKKSGWPDDTPAAILERVSMPWQKQASGTLNDISRLSQKEGISAPAILVVGKAAESGMALPHRPRILFTGLDPANFRTLGRIMHWPAIRTVRNEPDCLKLPETTGRLAEDFFTHAIFTSRTSVRMFFDETAKLDLDCRILSGCKVVACGAGTAGALKEYGLIADLVPRGMNSAAILSAVSGDGNGSVLLLQSATAAEKLANALAARLGNVCRLCLHEVVPHPELGGPLPPHDVIYFTCPSGVRACWAEYGRGAFEKDVWCIGDMTRKQVEEYGMNAEVINPYVS